MWLPGQEAVWRCKGNAIIEQEVDTLSTHAAKKVWKGGMSGKGEAIMVIVRALAIEADEEKKFDLPH